MSRWKERAKAFYAKTGLMVCKTRQKLQQKSGQGTTEYAILVGVLVVIAIIAIGAFRGNLQALWTAIQDGINGL